MLQNTLTIQLLLDLLLMWPMTRWVLKYCNELLNRQLELMGISETLDIYFSYSRDDVLRYIMELSSEGDEIYKNYLSNFEEEQPVGERIITDSGVEI